MNINQLREKLKIVETVLKSPNLDIITKNLGVEEKSLKDYQENKEKKLTDLREKMIKNSLILETTNNRIIKIFLYHD